MYVSDDIAFHSNVSKSCCLSEQYTFNFHNVIRWMWTWYFCLVIIIFVQQSISIMYIICKYSTIRVTGYASCDIHKLLVYCLILCIIYYDLQFEINYLLYMY